MKSNRLLVAAVTVVLGLPVVAFAQSGDTVGSVHRQDVQELRALESVGYNPSAVGVHYPNKLQAAERRIHDQGIGVDGRAAN